MGQILLLKKYIKLIIPEASSFGFSTYFNIFTPSRILNPFCVMSSTMSSFWQVECSSLVITWCVVVVFIRVLLDFFHARDDPIVIRDYSVYFPSIVV